MTSRILFLINKRGDQRLIADWVRDETPHSVIDPANPDEALEAPDFDLCILDLPSLRRYEDRLKELREASRPSFLPFLLLLSKDREDRKALSHLDSHRIIDEAVWIPASKFELNARINNLLQRRRDSERLNRKNEQLEILNRIIRHDIRNDMNVILAHGWELEQELEGDRDDLLKPIISTGEHVVELTEVARDFVEALETGKTPALQPIELQGVIETSVENVRTSSKDVDLIVEDIPDVEVQANELLATVFNNLITNGIRHNDREIPVIRISAEDGDGNVVVSIADNGPGVPDESKELIFGRGEKGPESEGTGIGLYLVHTLVNQYGGKAWVEDGENGGAVFKIRLVKAE